jgi:hypothetical protein
MAVTKTKEKRGRRTERKDDIPITRDFLSPLLEGKCPEKDNCEVWKDKGSCDLSCFMD